MSLGTYLLEYHRYCNLIGIALIIAVAWVFSGNKKAISLKKALQASGMLVALSVILIWVPAIGQTVIMPIGDAVNRLFDFANMGAAFVFGPLACVSESWGCIFAFRVLPAIIFFGALTSLLFWLGIIQVVVAGVNKVIRPLLGTTGPETLCSVANVFLGQTEAPLLIRNYLAGMTRSQMFVVMVSGMATISVPLMAVYSVQGVPIFHMVVAGVLAIPGAMLVCKIMVPEESNVETNSKIEFEKQSGNIFDAIFQGTSAGMSLAVNVAAMLIVFLALLPMLNAILVWLGGGFNMLIAWMGAGFALPDLSVEYLLGLVCTPFTYLMGFTGERALAAGQLLGIKLSLNEFIAFSKMTAPGMVWSVRDTAILTYALCAFANFASIGIQVGGIGALVPEKRHWIAELGLRAVLASTLVNLLSAFVVGLLI